MPGLLNAPAPASSPSPTVMAAGGSGIWSKKRDVITFDQLQKFWSELPFQARQELLRIDKQALFEQARRNLYCSRCNGLLLEGFSQIVMYGKSLQQEGLGIHLPNGARSNSRALSDSDSDDAQDPSVHPWGGLAATKDGILTLVNYFINARSLKALQNVFDSARARERERELLYPDACGGGGRGWISQGMTNYGRGHGTRDTCALHTARLSCDTLVDFWSALGEETRTLLLRMKEEDFIERLMYRFDSKRFCRDCRRNVIREFKELKELKRMRRELRCTSWFCVADTAFQYEVSEDMVQADWHQSFTDTVGTYHHFEWAIGTAEGKSDIFEFEDVGMNGKVQVSGLDLGGLSSCFITLRAWKLDGRCTELCVKAHALKGKLCVHRRLIIGDGFVTITKGESIRSFFEHAEEAEEEEDDDAMDKDGNELDGDGSRPQKHAKSPELAREFLLDAATVIFKEQVEKAFREGTARQNAHSIFVSLALKLLEDRVHVACKEIITMEKQNKLLEEEEREKHEEEERRERRRTKEREKKLRRKERLKGKEREREKKIEATPLHLVLPTSASDSPISTHGESSPNAVDIGDSISDPGDIITPTWSISHDVKEELSSNKCVDSESLRSDRIRDQCHDDGEISVRDSNSSFILEQSKSSRRKLRFKNDPLVGQASKCYDGTVHHESDSKLVTDSRLMNGGHRLLRERVVKNSRSCNSKFSEKFHCSSTRLRDRYEFQSCSCSPNGDHRIKESGSNLSTNKSGREMKTATKSEPTGDMARSLDCGTKYNQGCFLPEICALPNVKLSTGVSSRDVAYTKQVWEPMDARRKGTRSNSNPDCTTRSALVDEQSGEVEVSKPATGCLSEIPGDVRKADTLSNYDNHEDEQKSCSSGFVPVEKSDCYSKDGEEPSFPMGNACGDPVQSSSSSDNCSSCLSEGDSSTSSSSAQNTESSSTSDSEDASPQSEERLDTSSNKYKTKIGSSVTRPSTEFSMASSIAYVQRQQPGSTIHNFDSGGYEFDMFTPQQILPMYGRSIHMPLFPPATVGYHNQSSVPWPALPTTGLMSFPQPNHFVFPPSSLGYSLPAAHPAEFGMQYNSLQAAAPLYNAHHHSLYQSGNRVYVPNLEEQAKSSSISEPTSNVNRLERSIPNRQLPSKPPLSGQNGGARNASRPQDGCSAFSLFHFGGPVAGAAGPNASSVSAKEERTGRTVSASAPQADTGSKVETMIEEYSLFSAGNGTMFSFF
ncbi:uncharacterized protein M6B38_272975 [Iris pallida]|uniref:Uncharacterized protein n=1 Tax=Iris pallida TaxID=29817 RepID=A0AAX6I4F1_IRIPA|nr:uncharacterized protein M6B38_272975 [Iris pallida]